MTNQENRSKDFFISLKKWSPGIALSLLTVALMIFFKVNQGKLSGMLQEGKGELLKLYTANLQPLLEQTTISDEDIFNFALYRNLPVNKDRKRILQIDADEQGDDFFEILPASVIPETRNYTKFIEYMNLQGKDLDSLNSLLESYRSPIYASILVKDEETVAVDPNIINLHKALLADLMRFAYNNNPKLAKNIIPADYTLVENPGITSYVADVKSIKPTEYIFYTPDTIFNVKCQVDKKSIYSDIKNAEKTGGVMNPVALSNYVFEPGVANAAERSSSAHSFNYKYENGAVKIYPSSVYMNEIVVPELKKLNEELGKFSIKMTSDIIDVAKVTSEITALAAIENLGQNIKIDIGDDFKFEFNLENFATELEKNIRSNNQENWEEFGKKMQSMAFKIASQYQDSLSAEDRMKLKDEMKKLKEELKDVSKEMSNSRKLYKPKRK